MSNLTPIRTIGRAVATSRAATSSALTGRAIMGAHTSAARAGKYAGIYSNGRQGRQQARQWRRGGDWEILGFPTALLWLDDVCAAAAVDADDAAECAAVVTDLWP